MKSSDARKHALRGWRSRAALAAIACMGAGVLALGCGGAPQAAVSGPIIGVTEHDFRITTSTAAVAAGVVTLSVHNGGPDQHELIVVPERRRGEPVRSDGFTLNEEVLQSSEPGSLAPGRPGSTRYLKVNLSRGRYLLFCNMEGHFMAGMHTELVVS